MRGYFLVLACGSLLFSGCGGDTADDNGTNTDGGSLDSALADSGQVDATIDTSTTDSSTEEGIWPASASKLVAINLGAGNAMPGPAGSECIMGKARYELLLAQNSLSWSLCDSSDSTKPFKMLSGARTITAAESTELSAAMKLLKIATEAHCGADKPMLSLLVTTPSGEHEYVDSFYQCNAGGKVYVDGIDQVFTVMGTLAK